MIGTASGIPRIFRWEGLESKGTRLGFKNKLGVLFTVMVMVTIVYITDYL